MMRRNFSEILTLAAAAVLAAGCAGRIDPQGYCDGTVSFAVDVAGSIEEVKAGTKAGDAQTISSFKVAAYNNNGSDHAQFIAPDTEVTVSGSSASTGIRWTKPYAKVFYAYANLPASGATVSAPDYTGQTLTFTALPAVVENQTDVLLAAEATNGGGTRTAELSFKHALASVTFAAGQMENVATVTSLTVKRVYKTGSVKQNSDGTFGAWSGTTEKQDIAQTGLSVTPPVSGSAQIGSTLLLIPQTGSIDIELGVTMTGGGTKTLAGTVSIDGNAWQAGYATTYTIGYTEQKDLNFTAEVTAWGNSAASQGITMAKRIGPDPDYWVDLGMVSDNGKKMYVAKYDVDTFDPETGIATFKTDGTLGTKYSVDPDDNDLSKIKRSQEGQSCRLISQNEEIALLNSNNFDSQTSNGITTLTSKMNGNTVSFANGSRLVSLSNRNPNRYCIFYIEDTEYLWEGDGEDGSIRLVCETDEILTPIGLKAYCARGAIVGRVNFSLYTEVNDGGTFETGVSSCNLRPALIYDINNNSFEYWNYDILPDKYLIDGENIGSYYFYGSRRIEITSPNYNLRIGITVLNDDYPL